MLRRDFNEDKAQPTLPSNFDGQIRAKDISSRNCDWNAANETVTFGDKIGNDSAENIREIDRVTIKVRNLNCHVRISAHLSTWRVIYICPSNCTSL